MKAGEKVFTEITIVSSAVMLCSLISYHGNNCIGITRYSCLFENLPKSFDGYKILQISDLHSKTFGKAQKHLLKKIKNEKPDLIVITGDVIDVDKNFDTVQRRLNKVRPFLLFASGVAPTYYTTGNHEIETGYKDYIWSEIERCGVKVIVNQCAALSTGSDSISLIGAADPCFYGARRAYKQFAEQLDKLCFNAKSCFKIVLSHRPELFDIYADCKANLVFSGHAHGGQFRIPFTSQGLYAPEQGVLPKYTQGVHVKDKTTMVVSRGMGNSRFPQRLFNRPEIVMVTLLKK